MKKKIFTILFIQFIPIIVLSQNYKFLKECSFHKAGISFINLRNEDNLLITADSVGNVDLIQLPECKLIKTTNIDSNFISDINFKNKGDKIILASYSGKVYIYTFPQLKKLFEFKNPSIPAYGIYKGNEVSFSFFNPTNDNIIYFGGYNAKLVEGNLITKNSKVLYTDKKGAIVSANVNSLGNIIALAAAQNIYFFDLLNNKILKSFSKSDNFEDFPCEIHYFNQNKNNMVSYTYSCKVDFMNTQKATKIKTLTATHKMGSSNLALTYDDKFLVCGNDENKINIFDIKSGKKVQVLKRHKDIVTNFSLSYDNKYLISGSRDASIIVWQKLQPKKIIKDSKFSERKNIVDKEYNTADSIVTLYLYDDCVVDSDIITLFVNHKKYLDNYELKKEPMAVEIRLKKGKNNILIYPISEGRNPPTTVSVKLKSKTINEKFIIRANKQQNSIISIVKP